MSNLNWNELTPLQLGRFAEYYAKMELVSYGFDVYTSEVDDHGIDFIAKSNRDTYFEFQVKSKYKSDYVFLIQSKFDITQKNLYLILIIFELGKQPKCYLIPSSDWSIPNDLLRVREYKETASLPEYGLNLSKKNMKLLEHYDASIIIPQMLLKRGDVIDNLLQETKTVR